MGFFQDPAQGQGAGSVVENHEGGRGVIEKVENILQLRSNKVNLDPQSLSDDVVHHCFDRFSCKQNIDLSTTTINSELHVKDEYFCELEDNQ